jgi:UDP-N-acetylglucosamine 2-epimerase (non-hydrolysing)
MRAADSTADGQLLRVLCVAGARPNFVKIAPLLHAFRRNPSIRSLLIHTGQHYDDRMSHAFFRELEIPPPAENLDVGSGSHAVQTAEVMKRFEPVVLKHRPDAVLVVGDVNSTVACGLVSAKLGVRLIHVEAGLRSFDRTMPEEINRVLTDAISDLLFCTEPSAMRNLKREGIPEDRTVLAGNVMIDTLLRNLDKASGSRILDDLHVGHQGYAVLTLHRPANVDSTGTLAGILDAIDVIQRDWPVVFPVHPRTARALEDSPLGGRIRAMPGMRTVDPMGYLDFLRLLSAAKFVLTDSGGIQEETTALKVPCLTLRNNTERPITVEIGSNRLVGMDPERILDGYRDVIHGRITPPQVPPLWDGHAAERIVGEIAKRVRRSM